MKINDAKSFGETIKKRRKELGYTQAYISSFTGYSTSFISDLENGKATCEIGKCITLSNLLDLDFLIEPRGK